MNEPKLDPAAEIYYDFVEDSVQIDPLNDELIFTDRNGQMHHYKDGQLILDDLAERFHRLAGVLNSPTAKEEAEALLRRFDDGHD
jgi:hypothetical protein